MDVTCGDDQWSSGIASRGHPTHAIVAVVSEIQVAITVEREKQTNKCKTQQEDWKHSKVVM